MCYRKGILLVVVSLLGPIVLPSLKATSEILPKEILIRAVDGQRQDSSSTFNIVMLLRWAGYNVSWLRTDSLQPLSDPMQGKTVATTTLIRTLTMRGNVVTVSGKDISVIEAGLLEFSRQVVPEFKLTNVPLKEAEYFLFRQIGSKLMIFGQVPKHILNRSITIDVASRTVSQLLDELMRSAKVNGWTVTLPLSHDSALLYPLLEIASWE